MSALSGTLRDNRARVSLLILGLMVMSALLAPLIAPFEPTEQVDVLQNRFLSPFDRGTRDAVHLLGTDSLGRDVWSRLIYGTRISLSVALTAVALSLAIGTTIGTTAAYVGGRVDRVLMTLTDAVLAMPRLVLLLALVAIWRPNLLLVVLVLGFTGWMGIARLVRAEILKQLELPFVSAARATGLGHLRLLGWHVLPNAMTPALVAAALGVGNAIGLEAGLSFLGLGVPPPAPSWGNMIAAGRDALVVAPWVATAPGVAVVLAVVACNLLGDAVQDARDPTAG